MPIQIKDNIQTNRLASAILECEKLIFSYTFRSKADSRDGLNHNTFIVSELLEIVVILKMIYKNAHRANLIISRLTKPHSKNPKNIAIEYFDLSSELRIYIKSLFEWLYHIKELLENNRALISVPLMLRLKTFCEFRHKLITHKRNLRIKPMGAIRFSRNSENIQLFMTSAFPSEASIKELDELFSNCTAKLTAKESTEINYHERTEILQRNLEKYEGSLRGEIISFMEKFGTVSINVIEIAEYITCLVKELIPKLTIANN